MELMCKQLMVGGHGVLGQVVWQLLEYQRVVSWWQKHPCNFWTRSFELLSWELMGEEEVNGVVLFLVQMQHLVLFFVQLLEVSQEQDSLPILRREVSRLEKEMLQL